ncbi:hypothetical protein TNCV_1895881 [Trichonephila clavipes]|nr:hypothetical protein TNCV_1895881 [Trichonephila clavipes]
MTAVDEWYRYRIVAGFVTSSSPVPLKIRRVGQRYTLNLSRAETSSRCLGVDLSRCKDHVVFRIHRIDGSRLRKVARPELRSGEGLHVKGPTVD